MDICEACGSVGTLVSDGTGTVCSACGIALAQPSLEASTFSKGTIKQPKETRETNVSGAQRGNKDRVMHVYIYALQRCLMDHVAILIQWGVDPVLESVVRRIWFRTLEVSQCLEPGAIHKASQLFSPLTSFRSAIRSVETREKELLSEERIYDHYASFTACLYRYLELESILWVLYAALVWVQEAISPLDLSLWIQRDELPYLKLPEFQETAESRFRIFLPKLVFHPRKAPTPLEIAVGSMQLASDIGLELPPVNVPLEIARCTCMLNLAEDIRKQATALYQFYWRESECEKLDAEWLYYLQMVPVACILAAMKLTYGLDDAQRYVKGNQNWIEWAQKRWRKCVDRIWKYVPQEETLLEMSLPEMQDYVRYVTNSVLAGYDARMSFSGVERNLNKLMRCRKARETDVTSVPLPKRRLTTGVHFGMGKKTTYVPPLYRYPCPMYWFVLNASKDETSVCYPLDFLAVISVLCETANVKPCHLLPCLASLEKKMLKTEIDLVRRESIQRPVKSVIVNGSFEKRALSFALKEMGCHRKRIKRCVEREGKQILKLHRKAESEAEQETATDASLVMKAVGLYHKTQAANALFRRKVQVPHIDLERMQRSAEKHEWSESAKDLLQQVSLAQRLGQPIMSLGTRYVERHSLHMSQVWAKDDFTDRDAFMSDVDPIEEEEEINAHAIPSFHMPSNVDDPSEENNTSV